MAVLDVRRCRPYRSQPERSAALSMKNGFYSIHIHMLDGVRGRDSGVFVLRNGVLIGGGPFFLAVGGPTRGKGAWKGGPGPKNTTPVGYRFVRPLFPPPAVPRGFFGGFF